MIATRENVDSTASNCEQDPVTNLISKVWWRKLPYFNTLSKLLKRNIKLNTPKKVTTGKLVLVHRIAVKQLLTTT